VRAQAAVEEATRKAARAEDALGAARELAAAKTKLAELSDRAKTEALTAAGIKWFTNLFSGAGKAAGVAAAITSASQTSFSGARAAQVFGGRLGTMDKIEKNTRDAADDLDEIKRKPGGIPVT
jgi:hypothetical protein